LAHQVASEHTSGLAIEVMTIDAVDDDGLAVDEQVLALHFYAAEADFLRSYLNDLAGRVD